MNSAESDHFKGKEAKTHVAEAQANGLIEMSEIHGTEIPGSLSSGSDAARETIVLLLLMSLFFNQLALSARQSLIFLVVLIFGWLVWKAGRSAWLSWSRLERLHRILEEERWEIEHNRAQERAELTVLYAAKGFEGSLLEDVIDVLMADQDRLLKVMVEEELGLSLEAHEHPLKQGLGAALGVLVSGLIACLSFWIWPTGGIGIAALIIIVLSSLLSAYYQKNRLIPAVIWNLGITCLAVGSAYFLFEYVLTPG